MLRQRNLSLMKRLGIKEMKTISEDNFNKSVHYRKKKKNNTKTKTKNE